MNLRLTEYQALEAMAERETRTPDQQALFMLRKLLVPQQGPGLVDEIDGNGEWEVDARRNGEAEEDAEIVTIAE